MLLFAVIGVTVVLAALLAFGVWSGEPDEPDWWPEFEQQFDQYVKDELPG